MKMIYDGTCITGTYKICTAEETSYFVNTFKGIQANISEVEFDREWEDLKANEIFTKRPKINKYFEHMHLYPFF